VKGIGDVAGGGEDNPPPKIIEMLSFSDFLFYVAVSGVGEGGGVGGGLVDGPGPSATATTQRSSWRASSRPSTSAAPNPPPAPQRNRPPGPQGRGEEWKSEIDVLKMWVTSLGNP